MSTLLVPLDTEMLLFDGDFDTDFVEEVLIEHGALPPIAKVTVNDLDVWMGVGAEVAENSRARHTLAQLTGVHLLCLGPVIIDRIDHDAAMEVASG